MHPSNEQVTGKLGLVSRAERSTPGCDPGMGGTCGPGCMSRRNESRPEWHLDGANLKRPHLLIKMGPPYTMVFSPYTLVQEVPQCTDGFLRPSTPSGKTSPPSSVATSSSPPASWPAIPTARAAC